MMGMRRRRAPEEPSVDLAPLAGLLLLILVFFVINLNYLREPSVEAKRPEAAAGSRRGPAIFIAVSGAGTVHLAGGRVELSAVRPAVSRLLAVSPRAQVMVVADDAARASLVARVVDECRLAGAEEISFSTRAEAVRHGG
jgi:biopolymer transport protein ExbD